MSTSCPVTAAEQGLVVMQKASSETLRAKLSVGCTLHELCTEDKNKVAKLLRQVCCIRQALFVGSCKITFCPAFM